MFHRAPRSWQMWQILKVEPLLQEHVNDSSLPFKINSITTSPWTTWELKILSCLLPSEVYILSLKPDKTYSWYEKMFKDSSHSLKYNSNMTATLLQPICLSKEHILCSCTGLVDWVLMSQSNNAYEWLRRVGLRTISPTWRFFKVHQKGINYNMKKER